MYPSKRGQLEPLEQIPHGGNEGLPAEIGFIALKEQEWLVSLIPHQINSQYGWLVAFDVILFKKQRGSATSVVEQVVVVEFKDQLVIKIGKEMLRYLRDSGTGVCKT